MAEPRENVAYLAQAIGPRPAGTEEEQQAALYITEQLQSDSGLAAVIEDFNCSPDHDLPRAALVALSLIMSLLALFLQVMTIPALIVSLIAAALFVTESLGKTSLSKLLGNGVSQNVVAKYVPAATEDAGVPRRRKVVLVAYYDSGKIRSKATGGESPRARLFQLVGLGGMCLIPLSMLVRSIVTFGGASLIAANVITGAIMVCAALPLVGVVLDRMAAYNEAANCNAAGVAVLMEVARRVGSGSLVASSVEARVKRNERVVHGEEAARDAGLIPDEAVLSYEAIANVEPAASAPEVPEGSAAARLLAAKAAVAALTGKPVSSSVNIELDEPCPPNTDSNEEQFGVGAGEMGFNAGLVSFADLDHAQESASAGEEEGESAAADIQSSRISPAAASAASLGAAGLAASSAASGASMPPAAPPSLSPMQDPKIPAWFKSAQEKAKKPATGVSPAHRSRYADALDAAARESAARAEAEARAASKAAVEATEGRLRQMRENIMEARVAPVDAEGSQAPQASEPPIGSPALQSASDEAASAAAISSAAAHLNEGALPEIKPAAPHASLAGTSPNGQAGGIGQVAAPAASAQRAALEAALPTVESDKDVPSALKRPSVRKKRSIALPSIAKSAASNAEAAENEGLTAEGKISAIRSLRAKLPLVGGFSASRDSAKEALEPTGSSLANAPALDGARGLDARNVPAVFNEDSPGFAADAASMSCQVGSEAVFAGATQMFEPYSVSEVRAFAGEAEAAIQGEDGYFGQGFSSASSEVDEALAAAADDGKNGTSALSAEEEGSAASSAAAESDVRVSRETRRTGYTKMPKSRIQGFLSRFAREGERRSVSDEHVTPQEWLNVDEDFDARSVGAARGGWESFRNDIDESESYDASSRRYSGELEAAFSDDDDGFRAKPRKNRRWEGGSASREQIGRVSMLSGYEEEADQRDAMRQAEEHVYRFRHPDIDVEVWFVALGSELAANGGMNAFMTEHAADLRGAVIVELEGLGAGDLAVVEKEGLYRSYASPSRMRRYVSKASAELGTSVARAVIDWRETTSSFVMKRGYQALHLVGLKDGKPAYIGQEDDVLENVDEEALMKNADFVMELLKQI